MKRLTFDSGQFQNGGDLKTTNLVDPDTKQLRHAYWHCVRIYIKLTHLPLIFCQQAILPQC